MRGAASVALAALVSACSPSDLADTLRREAPSPDGAFVARSWCKDLCDDPGSRTVTLSPADGGAGSQAPGEDVAAEVYISTEAGDEVDLSWTGDRTLQLAGPCLADHNFQVLPPRRFRDVSIIFVRTQRNVMPCWRQTGGRR